MPVIVRSKCSVMIMVIPHAGLVQLVMLVRFAMAMLMRVAMFVRMRVSVRMGMHDVSMPMFMRMRVLMLMRMMMFVRMTVAAIMGMAMVWIRHATSDQQLRVIFILQQRVAD